ncbi:MAG: DJ-1/PfpI family protein [Fretibacterium sp.]|nr:DJ-1/PfpI family protein [Fretibacterium sp.]
MAKVALFLIEGFEETEALTTVDILRRGELNVTTTSLTGDLTVKGKHGVQVVSDALFDDVKGKNFDMLVIPGGTTAYMDHEGLLELVRRYDAEKKPLGAICAAPAVFGKAGILKGRRAVCYPSMESYLTDAVVGTENVETDGHITTAKGPAITPFFALRLLKVLKGEETAKSVAGDFLIPLIS